MDRVSDSFSAIALAEQLVDEAHEKIFIHNKLDVLEDLITARHKLNFAYDLMGEYGFSFSQWDTEITYKLGVCIEEIMSRLK